MQKKISLIIAVTDISYVHGESIYRNSERKKPSVNNPNDEHRLPMPTRMAIRLSLATMIMVT